MAVDQEFVVGAEVRQAWEQEASAWESLWSQAVVVLTGAARLTRTLAGGVVEPVDFADFLASALGAVAANLGHVRLVTAGRPGSWESDLVEHLLTSTVGFDNLELLLQFRTEPVVVALNVAQLVEHTGCVTSFCEAEAVLPFASDLDENTRDIEGERLRAHYLDAYETYAARFTDAVHAHALTLEGLTVPTEGVPSLRVPVEVRVEADPELSWGAVENPVEWAGDPIVWRLWQHAVATVGFPTLAGDKPETGL